MDPKLPKSKTKKNRLQLLHQYYSYTGFYKFVWQGILRALPIVILLIVGLYFINHYFGINESLIHLTEILPIYGVLGVFFISETILGLIPPEIFIAWAVKLSNPWLYIGILAFLSYFGGLISYWIGRTITKTPRVHRYLETKMQDQLKHSKKWEVFL